MAETVRDETIRYIETLPVDASLDDIVYALYVRAQIERGLADIRQGRTVSHEEVMRDVEEWLRSAGQ